MRHRKVGGVCGDGGECKEFGFIECDRSRARIGAEPDPPKIVQQVHLLRLTNSRYGARARNNEDKVSQCGDETECTVQVSAMWADEDSVSINGNDRRRLWEDTSSDK
jgi:hypothetical protein